MNIYSKTTNSPQVSDTSHYTPELRFPGFKGNWEVKKISDLYERHIEKNNLTFREDSIISVANMYYKKDSTISDETYLKTYNVFRLNDIAFEGNKSASHAYGRFVQNTIGDGIVSHVFEVFRPISSNMYPLFWSYYINYERVMCPILEKSTKKTTMMTNLVAKDFLKQTILVPTLAEQQKIADCLSSLDEEIAAETQKADALKDHKKGLMQQLFPAISNEQLAMSNCVPKLRFSGFTGSWEVKKLGEVANLSKGKGIAKSDIDIHGQTPCIRYGELYTRYGEQIKTVFSRTNIPSQDLVLGKVNDVIIPSSGETHEDIATASCILVPGVAIGGDINILRTPLNGLFLSYYLNSAKKHEIAHIAQGDAVVHLYGTQLSKLSICFPPTLAEQQKIADCLSELDEMISAQQQKVEALKEHKKGLMQKLFPKMSNTK